jgi:two-component system sensor histidine kinase KdpD
VLKKFFFNNIKRKNQYIITVLVIVMVSALSYFFVEIIGYRVVAYLLLVTVSILALFFDILPVLLAAFLSALIWDFFFIPPRFTFQVDNAEDFFLLIMYFVIAMVHSVLTYKIRQIQKETGKKKLIL